MEFGKTCGIITGTLVAGAGIALYQAYFQAAGAVLALAGLSFVVHAVNACPMCKAK